MGEALPPTDRTPLKGTLPLLILASDFRLWGCSQTGHTLLCSFFLSAHSTHSINACVKDRNPCSYCHNDLYTTSSKRDLKVLHSLKARSLLSTLSSLGIAQQPEPQTTWVMTTKDSEFHKLPFSKVHKIFILIKCFFKK